VRQRGLGPSQRLVLVFNMFGLAAFIRFVPSLVGNDLGIAALAGPETADVRDETVPPLLRCALAIDEAIQKELGDVVAGGLGLLDGVGGRHADTGEGLFHNAGP
jgi:hypothetical protein